MICKKKACVAYSDAEGLACEAHPPRPACLYGKRYGTDVLFEMSEPDIIRWRDQCVRLGIRGGEFHERQLRELYAWRAACAEIDANHRVPGLERRLRELCKKIATIEDAIIATPAQSMRGVLIKLKLVDAIELYTEDGVDDDPAGRLVVGLIADLAAFAGGVQ